MTHHNITSKKNKMLNRIKFRSKGINFEHSYANVDSIQAECEMAEIKKETDDDAFKNEEHTMNNVEIKEETEESEIKHEIDIVEKSFEEVECQTSDLDLGHSSDSYTKHEDELDDIISSKNNYKKSVRQPEETESLCKAMSTKQALSHNNGDCEEIIKKINTRLASAQSENRLLKMRLTHSKRLKKCEEQVVLNAKHNDRKCALLTNQLQNVKAKLRNKSMELSKVKIKLNFLSLTKSKDEKLYYRLQLALKQLDKVKRQTKLLQGELRIRKEKELMLTEENYRLKKQWVEKSEVGDGNSGVESERTICEYCGW